MASSRDVRLPLQVGTSCAFSLLRSATTLVPGLFLAIFGAGAGLALGYAAIEAHSETAFAFAVFLVVAPLLLIPYSIVHLRLAWRSRPSDVVLTSDGVRVEGGRRGGVQRAWSDIAPRDVVILRVVDKRLTLHDIYSADWAEEERGGVHVVRLAIRADGSEAREDVDGNFLILAEGELPEEIASIGALHASLRARARKDVNSSTESPNATDDDDASDSEDDSDGDDGTDVDARAKSRRATQKRKQKSAPTKSTAGPIARDVVTCPQCSAPAVPADADSVTCRYCRGEVPIAREFRTRIHAALVRSSEHARAESLVEKLVDQPGAGRVGFVFFIFGALMIAAWPASLVVMIERWHLDDLGWKRVVSLLVFPSTIVVGLYFLLRAQLADRFALRVLTLGFGARSPQKPGDPFECRRCLAPLPERDQAVVVRCVYCDADNVLGIDLRRDAQRERSQAMSLDEALRRRGEDRQKWWLAAVGALPVVALGTWLLYIGARPLPKTHTLSVDASGLDLTRITTRPADERSVDLSPDGRTLAIEEQTQDGDRHIVTVDAHGAHRRVLAANESSSLRPVWISDKTIAFSSGNEATSTLRTIGSTSTSAYSDLFTTHGEFLSARPSPKDPSRVAVELAHDKLALIGVVDAAALRRLGDDVIAHDTTIGRDPHWSRDGEQIAFVRSVDAHDQIFVLELGSFRSPRAVTSDALDHESPCFVDDSHIAFTSSKSKEVDHGGSTLDVARVDGSARGHLTRGDADVRDAACGANGEIFFSADVFTRYDIFRARFSGDSSLTKTATAKSVALDPLATTDASSDLERLTTTSFDEFHSTLGPDGRLYFDEQARGGNMMHVVALPAVGEIANVARELVFGPRDSVRSPTFSSDGKTMLFVDAPEKGTSLQRHAMEAGPDAFRTVYKVGENLVWPHISPDGSRIVIQQVPKKGDATIVSMSANGSGATTVGVGVSPAFFPSGDAIVFSRAVGGHDQIFTKDLATSVERQVVHSRSADDNPSVTPDGRHILFVSTRTSATDDAPSNACGLYVVGLDGRDLVALTRGTACAIHPSWGSDGRVYFSADVHGQYDLYRVKVRALE